MSSHSMATGDPYCPIHGFTPCRCWEYRQFAVYQPFNPIYNMIPTTLQMPAITDTCSGCGKHPSVCMCASSSDPFQDLVNDLRESRTKKTPVKKWADECKENAQKVNAAPEPEPKSLYIFMLERCKRASAKGEFAEHFFWKTNLPIWSAQEIQLAADMLREDNFQVEVVPLDNDIRVRISWE